MSLIRMRRKPPKENPILPMAFFFYLLFPEDFMHGAALRCAAGSDCAGNNSAITAASGWNICKRMRWREVERSGERNDARERKGRIE